MMFNEKYHLLSIDSNLKMLNKKATKINETPILLIKVEKAIGYTLCVVIPISFKSSQNAGYDFETTSPSSINKVS